MKKIIVSLMVFGSSTLWPSLTHAECPGAVLHTQSAIQDLFQQTLNADQQLHLRDLLLELCVQRVAGSSVVKQPARTIYGTQGMKRDRFFGNDSGDDSENNGDDTVIVLGIDLDRREHKETPHFPQ